jgi:hypothetical protein
LIISSSVSDFACLSAQVFKIGQTFYVGTENNQCKQKIKPPVTFVGYAALKRITDYQSAVKKYCTPDRITAAPSVS